MTICIGVICDEKAGLITVSDDRVSTGCMSADILMKNDPIGGEWLALYAGEVSPTTPLIASIQSGLSNPNATKTLESVSSVCLKAYRGLVAEEAAAHILSPFNLTMSEFLQSGQAMFPPNEFSQLMNEIRTHHLTRSFCDLLICGFDQVGEAHVFTIKNLGS